MAMGKEQFAELLDSQDYSMVMNFKQEYIDALRQYYYVGGMPEAVQNFADNRDFNEVRKIQKRILMAYEQDFSKHAPIDMVPKIRMVWNSIPSQLAKENKKFIYGVVREGARAKDYETAIMWLSDCGLIHKVSRVSQIGVPLKAYEDLKAFKIYLVDVGLLSCMVGLRQRTLIEGNSLFVEFKGTLLTGDFGANLHERLQEGSVAREPASLCRGGVLQDSSVDSFRSLCKTKGQPPSGLPFPARPISLSVSSWFSNWTAVVSVSCCAPAKSWRSAGGRLSRTGSSSNCFGSGSARRL